MDIADLLNNNGDDEHKISSLVSSLDASDLSIGNSIYAASKYALARWVRRHSAIIHYCGRNKPWKKNYLGKLDVFWHEAEAL